MASSQMIPMRVTTPAMLRIRIATAGYAS